MDIFPRNTTHPELVVIGDYQQLPAGFHYKKWSSNNLNHIQYTHDEPVEIQVEPDLTIFQNSDSCSQNNNDNNNFFINNNNSPSSDILPIDQWNIDCSQLINNDNCNYEEYVEPEENFISLDELKVNPEMYEETMREIQKEKELKSQQQQQQQKLRIIDEIVIDSDNDEEDENITKNIYQDNEQQQKRNFIGCDGGDESIDDRIEMDIDINDEKVILIDSDYAEDDEINKEDTLDWYERRQTSNEQEHNGAYECNLCNKRVASSYNLRRHMMIHTGERPFGCDLCDKRFREFSDLKKHRRVHSNHENFKCMVCRIYKPSPTNPTKCENCDRGGKQQQQQQHQTATTSIATTVNNSLSHGYSLSSIPDNLFPESYHCAEGGGRKRGYSCPICDRIFGSRHNLKRHFMIHTGEKPYQCNYCSRAFREASSLRKHKLIHTKNQCYKCEICDEEFTNVKSFHTHNLQHKGDLIGNLIAAQEIIPKLLDIDNDDIDQNNSTSINISNSIFSKGNFLCYVCNKKFHEEAKLNAHFIIHKADIKKEK